MTTLRTDLIRATLSHSQLRDFPVTMVCDLDIFLSEATVVTVFYHSDSASQRIEVRSLVPEGSHTGL